MKQAAMGWALTGLLLGVGSAWAEELAARSTITAVTVLTDRALVVRTATLKVPVGSHAVRFDGLPSGLEADAVSARAEGPAGLTLFGAQVVTRQLEEAQDPRLKELERELLRLRDRERALHEEEALLKEKRAFLTSIRAATGEQLGRDLVTQPPDVGAVGELLALLDQEFARVVGRTGELAAALREVREAISRVERERAALSQTRGLQETAVLVDLAAARAGECTVEIAYRVPGATWEPVYDARAGSDGAEAIIWVSNAVIRQRTGEDWAEAAITLSTAQPAVGARMPILEPWYLRPWEVGEVALEQRRAQDRMDAGYKGERTKPASLLVMQDQVMSAAEAPSAPAEMASAAVATQGPAVTFLLPRRETIVSDWQPRKVQILSESLPAAFAYEVTPRLVPAAYLRAKVTNAGETLRLPGRVQVFLDEAFVGVSSIDTVAPGASFDLSLGVDPRVTVKRTPLKEKVDVSFLPSLRGRTKTINFAFLATVENYTPKPVRVVVFDQVPVSQHDQIVVEDVSAAPKAAGEDPERPGVSRWEFTLAPKGKQELRLSFRVRHPVELDVDGL